MKFDNLYNDWYLGESVLDLSRTSLDSGVFQFPEDGTAPIIHARIKQQIIDGVRMIHLVVPVQDYYVIGSILTPKYNDYSDIDVTCEVEEEISPIAMENLISVLNHINGKLAIGTLHPINFHIVRGMYDQEKAEAIYDIANDRWIKEPDTYRFEVKNILGKFKTELASVDLATAELRRDLIDYDKIKSLSKEDVQNLEFEIEKVLSAIEADVINIVKVYDNARLIRKQAFEKPMSPMEIRKFGIKNNLPENILYKLLERYYYKDLANRLKELLTTTGEVHRKDVPKIKKTLKDFIKEF